MRMRMANFALAASTLAGCLTTCAHGGSYKRRSSNGRRGSHPSQVGGNGGGKSHYNHHGGHDSGTSVTGRSGGRVKPDG